MVDRQDIDALLVGALYGELTPADESRLAAHLESHPADRAALENMTRAREAVRESRVLADQHEPPQSVSALLLQEAARRAPRPAKAQETAPSWFERLTRSFMAHPAMAAAAMLVIVVGVAGTMYLRRGDQYVDSKAVAMQREEQEQGAKSAPAATPSVGMAQAAQGSAAAGDLAREKTASTTQPSVPPAGADNDSESYRVTLNDPAARADDGTKAEAKEVPAHRTSVAKPAPARIAAPDASRARGNAGLTVTTPQPRPQELGKTKLDDDFGNTNGEVAQQRRAPADNAKKDAPPPAPAVATAPPRPEPAPAQAPQAPPPPPKSPVADKAGKNIANGPATGGGDASANDQQLAAAAAMHAEAKRLAKSDCRAATKQVLAIAAQYPDYYNAKVVNDRDLKACTAYIDAARNSENEKQQKSRAQKRPANMDAPNSVK